MTPSPALGSGHGAVVVERLPATLAQLHDVLLALLAGGEVGVGREFVRKTESGGGRVGWRRLQGPVGGSVALERSAPPPLSARAAPGQRGAVLLWPAPAAALRSVGVPSAAASVRRKLRPGPLVGWGRDARLAAPPSRRSPDQEGTSAVFDLPALSSYRPQHGGRSAPRSERAALGEALLFLGEELAAIAERAHDARRSLASGEASTGTTALGVIEQRAGDAVHHAERLLGGSQLSRAGGEPSSEAAAS